MIILEHELDVRTFKNMLNLKFQLISNSIDELTEYYQNPKRYELFLHTTYILLKVDPGFFSLDSMFMEKVKEVISIYRFSLKDKNNGTLINHILGNLNEIRGEDEYMKERRRYLYMFAQETIRGIEFEQETDCLEAILADALVLDAVNKNDFSGIDDVYLLSSLHYYLWHFPDVYLEDSVKEALLRKVADIIDHTKWYSFQKMRSCKEVQKQMRKIKKEKEEET